MPDPAQTVHTLLAHSDGSWLVRRDLGRVHVRFPTVRPQQPRWHVWRPDDMVLLTITASGLAAESTNEGQILRRTDPAAILVVHFPPQSIAEEVIPDYSPIPDVPSLLVAGALPVRTRHAGQTRLAYRMPTEIDYLPLTAAAALRAMAEWPLERTPLQPDNPIPTGIAFDISQLISQVVTLIPEEHVVRTRRIADSAASRAVDTALGWPVRGSVIDAIASMTTEVAAAATTLDLDDEQRRAFQLQAELTFADRLLRSDASVLDVGEVIATLPALEFWFKPSKPAETVTAIELPYRLVQSPNATAAFGHALTPIVHQGQTELWHTRLGQRTDDGFVEAPEAHSTLTAIWSPDYGLPDTTEPGFTMSLTAHDRDEIVRHTADETGFRATTPPRRYVPIPSQANQLMLTALGGWLDLDGHWDTHPANVDGLPRSLIGWRHQAALGRDWFVEVVRIGQLLPTGHRAVVIELTERRFQDAPDGSGRVAVLRKRKFIEVREPLRTYPGGSQPFAGRDFPFRSVEILTKRTPSLLPPQSGFLGTGETDESFWPRVSGPGGSIDFRFEIRAVDIGGYVSQFDLPLRFVSDATRADPVIGRYNGYDQTVSGRTVAEMSGQLVQFVPNADRPGDPGDVALPVQSLRFGASAPTVAPPAESPLPRFYPWMRTAGVVSTTLVQLTGDASVGEMAYADVYRFNGFDPTTNTGEIFLTATATALLKVDFATRSKSDKAGGIVTPNFGVTGFSRPFGLVGGDTDLFAGGTFDPEEFLPSAKIFGGIDLKDILAPVAVGLLGAVVPKTRTTRTKEKLETVFEYNVDSITKNAPLLRMNERGKSALNIKAVTTAYFTVEDRWKRDEFGNPVSTIGSGPGGAAGSGASRGLKDPEASVEAKLTWFKLNFFGCIIVSFDAFTFKVSATKGVDPDPKIADTDGVVFGGPLAFVNDLSKMLSGDKKPGSGQGGTGGSGDNNSSLPSVTAKPIFKLDLSGLTVGAKLGLSTFELGIFTLKNLMISSAVTLPFDGKPLSFQFGFAERSNPFQLVVSLFGGGGFVVIGVDTEHGVKEVETALEFGAFTGVNFGIASGAIYVKAGIYIYWNKPEQQTTLKGYVEMGGEVQALGIISVSILLHLSLGYYKVGSVSEVRGQATLVIEVELLFFSASLNVTVERRFGGAAADPKFADLIPSAELWSEYAAAFA